MRTLHMKPSLQQDLFRQAAGLMPEEACGLLLGATMDRIDEVVHFDNESDDPEQAYLIDPERYLRLEAAATGRGVRVIGVWHSHPRSDAVPSATDLRQAWPNWHYLIVGRPGHDMAELRAWWSGDNGFEEETLST